MPDENAGIGYDVVDIRETSEIVGTRVVDSAVITIRTRPSSIEWSFTLPRDKLSVETIAASARGWAFRLEQARALGEEIP